MSYSIKQLKIKTMKNLILTFVLSLVTLITLSQSTNSVAFETSSYQGEVTHQDTIFANENIIFHVMDGNFTNYYQMDETYTTSYFSSQDFEVTQVVNIDDTLYVKMSNPGGGPSDYIKIVIIYSNQMGVSSVSENTLTREQLKVYPSPATSDLKISFSTDKTNTDINIFSLNGQLIYHNTDSKMLGMNTIDLNVSEWSPGIYLVNDGNETFKFVKL